MMVLNAEGNMEFPRDVMMQDCFPRMQEPLYGFVTNVTLIKDQLCTEDVDCFLNGTRINGVDSNQSITNRTNEALASNNTSMPENDSNQIVSSRTNERKLTLVSEFRHFSKTDSIVDMFGMKEENPYQRLLNVKRLNLENEEPNKLHIYPTAEIKDGIMIIIFSWSFYFIWKESP